MRGTQEEVRTMVCSQDDLAPSGRALIFLTCGPEQKIVRSCEKKECSDQF